MRDQWQVLLNHEIKFQHSCVGWGAGYILKCHGRLNDGEYPHQRELPMGGDELLRIVRAERVVCNEFHLNWDEFLAFSQKEDQDGHGVIFIFPSAVFFDFGGDGSQWWEHVLISIPRDGALNFFTRKHGVGGIQYQIPQRLRDFHDKLPLLGLSDKIHTFSHKA